MKGEFETSCKMVKLRLIGHSAHEPPIVNSYTYILYKATLLKQKSRNTLFNIFYLLYFGDLWSFFLKNP